MNTENTVTPPEAIPATNIQAVDFTSEAKQLHRKIAKLPKPLRDLINSSLDDGLPAKEIIQKLEASTNPPLPYPISSNNLSLPQATLQVIAGHCFEILGDFSLAAVKQKLAEEPLKYISLLHVFARLTREIVHLEKYEEARAAAQAQKSDPNRDPEAEAADFWTRHTKQLFNRKDPNRVNSTPTPTPTLTSGLPSEDAESVATASSTNSPHALRITHHDPPIENRDVPSATTSQILQEHCLDCHHPLPPLTPEGKRPNDRCEHCNILLPPPGTCTRPSSDKCHFCGVTVPRRLSNGRRPRPTCHSCGTHLGRELDE